MSKHAPHENGPSWRDVHAAWADIEHRHGVHIQYTNVLLVDSRSGQHTRLDVYRNANKEKLDPSIGWYGFRWPSPQWRTFPSALYWALLAIDDRLEARNEPQDISQDVLPF